MNGHHNSNDDDAMDAAENAEEWYMVLVFSLLFGFFITLFGTLVGYFALMEDRLFRRYRDEGETIRASVVSVQYRNHAVHRRGPSLDPECTVFVEYVRNLSDGYMVRIRKQVKARRSDFWSSFPRRGMPTFLMSASTLTEKNEDDIGTNGNGKDKVTDQGKDSEHANRPISPLSFQGGVVSLDFGNDDNQEDRTIALTASQFSEAQIGQQYLELLILPGHARSGFPKKQVHRSCGLRYRLPTLGLIAFKFALAALCAWLAANAALDLDVEQQRIATYSIAVFVVVILMEVPLIHWTLSPCVTEVLKDEYLNSGEFMPMQCDDSTISSHDDAYLA